MGYWQQVEKLTIANGTSQTFTLKYSSPLERLTIWAISGQRVLANVSFQPQLNGINFGGATVIVGTKAADIIYSSGGAANENAILPAPPRQKVVEAAFDAFTFAVVIANAGGASIDVTMMATAIEHNGG